MVLLNQHITTQTIITAVILLTGVYFIITSKKLVLFSRFIGKDVNRIAIENAKAECLVEG